MAESEKNWDDLGIPFRIATPEDQPDLTSFLMDCFFPDEPLFRSTEIMTDTSGCISGTLSKYNRDSIITPGLQIEGTSILAIKEGKIIGSR